MIKAEIIADSTTDNNHRLTTMVVTFPRFILAELNTHRMFSRNSASSRAIPFKKMVESVKNNPFIPIAWQKDHSGMQGTEYFDYPDTITQLKEYWLKDRDEAVNWAEGLNNIGLTKQLCNRLLEPFMWHTVIISATEWENFFELRCPQYVFVYSQGVKGLNYFEDRLHFRSKQDWLTFKDTISKDAECYHNNPTPTTDMEWLFINEGQSEIHMMALAEAMYHEYNNSKPKDLAPGEWHIPFGDNIDLSHSFFDKYKDPEVGLTDEEMNRLKVMISVARCARVSYTVVGEEGKPYNYENDIKLYDRLHESGHLSPFEHPGRAMTNEEYDKYVYSEPSGSEEFDGWVTRGVSGNFRGFIQYRKLIEVWGEKPL